MCPQEEGCYYWSHGEGTRPPRKSSWKVGSGSRVRVVAEVRCILVQASTSVLDEDVEDKRAGARYTEAELQQVHCGSQNRVPSSLT